MKRLNMADRRWTTNFIATFPAKPEITGPGAGFTTGKGSRVRGAKRRLKKALSDNVRPTGARNVNKAWEHESSRMIR